MKKRISRSLAVCAIIVAATAGSATPASYERRVINYQPVDLLPLFAWYEKPQGVRPLTSWKHLQGFLDRETMYGWLVRGSIEGQSGLQYFLLKNPPKKEIGRYRELENSLPKLEQDRGAALAVANLPAYQGWGVDVYGEITRVPTEDFDRIAQAKVDLHDIDARIAAVRQEMAAMLDARGYFKVDVFALQLNQTYQGSQVFDFGFPTF